MIDKTGFSIETAVDPYAGLEKLPDWVAFDLCKAYSAPDGNYLLHNTRNGKRAMVIPEVYASLLRCGQFQTIARHTANIIESNPGMKDQQATINDVLRQMLDIGMMVSATKVCNRLKAKVETSTEEKQSGAPVVAIITWERPQALERLLESIVANCDTQKVHRLYVIDDSRKAENISQNRALVEAFAARVETTSQYF
ncbi:glycosyltransferase family 2 protein, partial [Pseudomonadota bacterium]